MKTILIGDALTNLKQLPSESIQSIITSPPYWALRDYGVEGQIGLENTYEEYIEGLLDIFNECKRVLKKDGLLFINIADTYAGTGSKGKHTDPKYKNGRNGQSIAKNNKVNGVKRKSLIGIPQRLQIAMIEDGWICRNDIIWHKPNAMPQSVKDRFTVDYEHVFMFSKNYKYKFNQIKEPMKTKDLTSPRGSKGVIGQKNSGIRGSKSTKKEYLRNKRSVWSINTKPYSKAHFATFPDTLIDDLVLCSTDEGDIVLDPFTGSGTVPMVAQKYNRGWVAIELNPDYITLIKERTNMEE